MLSLALAALAFNAPMARPAGRSSVRMATKSKSVPFAEVNPVLAGLPGNTADFDPAMLATPANLKWMVEAELKHGRVAMLAAVGWVLPDLGFHFPGEKYAGLSSLQAHDAMVQSGDMFKLFLAIALVETWNFGSTVEMALGGNDREPGSLGFDPLNFKAGKDYPRLQLAEIKNGRLAMLAFSGMCTQAALTGKGFPYF